MTTIPYATQWIEDDDIQAVVSALKSPNLTQGPLVAEFERKVAEYCGSKYAVAVNSGTSALHIACLTANISRGDEVITPPITFVSSSNCILYCGGIPVFADIEEDTINIDLKAIKNSITSKTKAIIAVHFAGSPCDLEAISAVAKETNLIVIEDAAHALGAEYKGSKIGSCKYSDMTILSFHAVKHITTGEGGMVMTNNEIYYQKLLKLRTHGITRDPTQIVKKDEGAWYYEMHDLGFNYRMTDFQAALGISQLKKLDNFIYRRQEIVAKYQGAFSEIKEIILPVEKQDSKSAWHIYPIRVKNGRAIVFAKLRQAALGVNVHYYPVYLQPYYRELGYNPGICPNAEEYYKQAITLPLYPRMNEDDVQAVIEAAIKAVA